MSGLGGHPGQCEGRTWGVIPACRGRCAVAPAVVGGLGFRSGGEVCR